MPWVQSDGWSPPDAPAAAGEQIVVVRLGADGTGPEFAARLAGSGYTYTGGESPVARDGSIYVLATVGSADLPVKYQELPMGTVGPSSRTAYLFRLSADGSRIPCVSYLDGTQGSTRARSLWTRAEMSSRQSEE